MLYFCVRKDKQYIVILVFYLYKDTLAMFFKKIKCSLEDNKKGQSELGQG